MLSISTHIRLFASLTVNCIYMVICLFVLNYQCIFSLQKMYKQKEVDPHTRCISQEILQKLINEGDHPPEGVLGLSSPPVLLLPFMQLDFFLDPSDGMERKK